MEDSLKQKLSRLVEQCAYVRKDVTVVDNRWERCRIGLLVWDAPATHIGANHAVALVDDAIVIGPDAP